MIDHLRMRGSAADHAPAGHDSAGVGEPAQLARASRRPDLRFNAPLRAARTFSLRDPNLRARCCCASGPDPRSIRFRRGRCSRPLRRVLLRMLHPTAAAQAPAPPAALDPIVVTATRQRRARVRRAGVGRHHRRRDDPRRQPRSTCRRRWCGCRACSPPTARTTRRTCRSARAASARARRSACAACACTRTASRSTMPDGQGQTGSFSLLSAQRIEVLRGPFSTLYGNASGGVISVFTEDGAAPPVLTVERRRRQLRHCGRSALKLRGTTARTRATSSPAASSTPTATASTRRRGATSSTPSSRYDATERTRVTLIGNYAVPAGNAGSARPHARAMGGRSAPGRSGRRCSSIRARRSTRCRAASRSTIASTPTPTLHVAGYGGRRLIRQYLAFSGAALTSSGGVADLDRDFGGLGARLVVAHAGVRHAADADGRRRRRPA